MLFRRPVVPTRFAERALFVAGVLVVMGCGIYAMSAASRGLILWNEVPTLIVSMAIGALPLLVFGFFLRHRRLKSLAQLADYERVLAKGIDQDRPGR